MERESQGWAEEEPRWGREDLLFELLLPQKGIDQWGDSASWLTYGNAQERQSPGEGN